MRSILITGICGFVGSSLVQAIRESGLDWEIIGLDNFIRPGSEENRTALRRLGVKVFHGDLRCASDFETLPVCDWILDAAANPSVLAGVDGQTSSRQLVEHNLLGTVNLLECCKMWRAGFILLSTSRVYSIVPLAQLKLKVEVEGSKNRFTPDLGELKREVEFEERKNAPNAFPESDTPTSTSSNLDQPFPPGISPSGISESFSTAAPISLYGSTKLCSESLALEYGATFDLPVWINRCGVLAGAGQFGRADQGIFAYWIHSHRHRRPLKYIGFDGLGHQVRDCLHPRDLVPLLEKQFNHHLNLNSELKLAAPPPIINVSGGLASAMSLAQLTAWCDDRFGPHPIASQAEPRPFDLPWVVLDHQLASQTWNWQPQTCVKSILEEIATQAELRPDWLEISSPS